MKKVLLTISASIALTLSVNGQTLRNLNCESPMSEISGFTGNFRTSDNSWSGIQMRPEATNPHGGLQAIKVVASNDPTVNAAIQWGNDIVPGYATNTYKGAMPNIANTTVNFWYRATLIGGDKANVIVYVYDTLATGNTDDKLIFLAYEEITTTISEWTSSSLSLEKIADGTANKFQILITPSIASMIDHSVAAHAGSTIWVDDFTLTISGSNASLLDAVAESARAYPNPATNDLNIEMTEIMTHITISTIDGKIVSNQQVNDSTTKLNVTDLNSGTYLYKIVTASGQVITNTFVKK